MQLSKVNFTIGQESTSGSIDVSNFSPNLKTSQMSSLSVKMNQGAYLTRPSAVTANDSSYGSTESSGRCEPFSSNGDMFSENGTSAPPCGSEENAIQPLCTIKEAEEDYEVNLMEKLK